MGQKIGKAEIVDVVLPFCNLPRRAILNLWQVFNNVADGFGIDIDELQEICIDLKDELNISHLSMSEKISVLFRCFDTDNNGLIDALEFFSTIVVISGMKKRAIMEFVLTVYDFDGTDCLSFDEVVLALKSVSSGLCKIQSSISMTNTLTRSKIQIAKEEDIEQLVSEIFCSQSSNGELDDSIRLNIKILSSLLTAHPDVNYWFAYFSAPEQIGLSVYQLTQRDTDFVAENPIKTCSEIDSNVIDWNVQCQECDVTTDMSIAANHSSNKEEVPWKSAVALLTPVEFSEVALRKESPNATMHPEWIYGYQSEQCKCNLYYTNSGDVIYNVSRYAITYSIKNHDQKIFSGHSDDILALRLHPNRLIAATGEAGAKPKLLVWNVDTHKVLYSFQGFHKNGITQLAFSPCGKLLASIGNNVEQNISVCTWENGVVLFNSIVAPFPCLSCSILTGNTIVAAGHTFIYFWSKYTEGYVKRSGVFSRYNALQPITSLTSVHESENLISGTASGLLQLWIDVNCIRSVKAHNGTINTLYCSAHGILSGGYDQRIRMWSANLEPSFTFDVSHFGINPCVRSLCLATDGTSILVGTKGSNIYEISAIDGSDLRGGPIIVGHSYGDLHCVATHPSKFEFLTVGQDQTLRVFDMSTNTQLKIATFDGEARSVSYNPLGDMIVVGFAGPTGSMKCGAFAVLNEEDLSIVHEAKDSSSAVTVVSFSPEGETLAVGCQAGGILLYAVHDDYELVGKCDRHTSAVTHIDFSKDGEWIRSNSTDNDICFFNSDDASYQSNIASMRDVQWASNNCIYSWHTKSTHKSPFLSDTIICNQSLPIPEELVGTVDPYLASGTRLGYIRLYPFPCADEGAESHRYPAHTCQISALKFNFNGEKLISIGLKDRCIIQWQCQTYNSDLEVLQLVDPVIDSDLKLEMLTGKELQSYFLPKSTKQTIGLINSSRENSATILPIPTIPENVIWLNSIVEPTIMPVIRNSIPDLSLLLEHVYGYESQMMRNNVRYVCNNATPEIIYTVSTMGIVMNISNQSQRIFKLHSDSIVSFGCSKDGTLVATGQMGQNPMVFIWETKTCKTRAIIPEKQLNAISCIAFSSNNELIAIVNMDKDHIISVYDWKMNLVLSKAYGGCKRILGIFFTGTEDGTNNGYGLVTYGVHEIRFWNKIFSKFPTSIRPKLGESGLLQNFLCGEMFNNRPVIGTSDGYIYIFSENILAQKIKAHTGPLTAMDVSITKNLLVTGGKDGSIRIWSADNSCLKEFSLESILESHNPSVRSVAFNSDGTMLVVGTRAAEIFEISIIDGKRVGGKSLVDAHATRQLWGLSSHPTKDECITAGDDCTIRIWDCKNFVQKKSLKMDTASRAITYSPDGKLIAVGFGSGKRIKGKLSPKEGAFVIMRTTDLKIIHEGKDSNSAIRVLKFSPDMKTLAVGSDDNNVYLYNVKDEYSRKSTISSHQSPILFIDFSMEGLYIVSVDTAKAVFFSEVKSGITIPKPEALRNEKWATCTNPYMWAVQGFWQSMPPDIYPSTIQRSWGGLLLAAGSNAGSITIAHNPYPQRAGFLQSSAHAGYVSSMAWVAGDASLLSICTKDHTLMQWKCLYDCTRESGNEGGKSCDDSEIEIDGGHELSKVPIAISNSNAHADVKKAKIQLTTDGTEVVETKSSTEDVEVEVGNWYSMVCAPSNLFKDNQSIPSDKFNVDFTQGAKLGDVRGAMHYNEDGSLLYVVSSVGVIFDRNQVNQIFYLGHKNTIISLDVDKSGKLAVTGDLAESPEIHIWDAKTGTMVKKFENLHKQGISSLSFSSNAEYLVSLGQDVQNSIVILHSPTRQWMDGHVICSTPVSSAKMLWCLYTSSCSNFPIVVGGAAGNVFFFRVVRSDAERIKGVYGKRHKIQPMMCAIEAVIDSGNNNTGDVNSPTNTVMLCGTVTGYLYIFSGSNVINQVAAHEASINSICSSNKRFLTAGKDGKVKYWSQDLKLLHSFNINSYLPRPYGLSCHAVTSNKSGTSFCVGMRSGEVFEVSLQSYSYLLLIESHSRGELHALDINPKNSDEYVTAGDDGVVMVWSLSRRYCLRKVRVESASRAIAWSYDGLQIIVGFGSPIVAVDMTSKDGAFMVLDAESLAVIKEERKSKQAITDIKFSATSEFVALASSDGRVYIHCTKKFDLLRSIETPVRYCSITKIDFNKDASILRMCTNFDQLFYCRLESAGGTNKNTIETNVTSIRDEEWLQPTCPFTFFNQGVFRKGIDNIEVTAVSIHPNGHIIAVSYVNGDIRIYRYPCPNQQSSYLSLPGSSSTVSRIKFTLDGKFLVIIDSKSRSIFQYTVKSLSINLMQTSR